jgi:hypothetical protein
MKKEEGHQLHALLRRLVKYFLLACFWLVTIYWGILTYNIILEGLISPPFFIEGIAGQIWHLASEVDFSVNHNRLLEELAYGYLLYIAVSYLGLFSNLIMLCWKLKKSSKITVAVNKTGIREKIVEVLNKKIKPETMKSLQGALRWCLYGCFLAVTIVWCFYTIRHVSHLTESKYGVESIIRQEAPSAISKEQPLFVDSEIKGMTFDHAARLISIVYLKYIGLIYFEAIFIFLFVAFKRHSKEHQKERSDHPHES